jgi:hypothetical protein
VEQGVITKDLLKDEMRKNHIRHDTLDLLSQAPARAAA